ncbi:hypothetical protein D8674_024694 [Pyrus ussuriensis x Pyrus communis]|uniref:Zinc knuckle CX2CX4HX4C domain-containing protein n=1 Tax=Pyrus ussuriensis x Pyrus communis TaxID=2448454 RepID=A0A5N5H8R7_9ROSA|nr:hypothetical protein D8674_024694 [Pyrus ussuriensis x Pyrus communis]
MCHLVIIFGSTLTSKEVYGELFIDCFTSLWRGRDDVSIRDIGDRRFLARFVGHSDMQRVLVADQPWTFKNDLMLVADRTGKGLRRCTPLSFGVFWVQIHNVPPLSITVVVAEAIGGLMGTVRKVDTIGSCECIGRFLRVRICFNVRDALMRETFVDFPNEGMVWVDFKYESLPKYCLICGLMEHVTRVCRDMKKEDGVVGCNGGCCLGGLRLLVTYAYLLVI